MSNDFRDLNNPYATPAYAATPNLNPDLRQRVQGRVMAPAIALCVLATLALLNLTIGLLLVIGDLADTEQRAQATQAAIIQGGFVVVNSLIIGGAVQMMRFRTWGLALTAAILAMLNIRQLCCIPGIPVGIWTLVILHMPEVRAAFQAVASQTH